MTAVQISANHVSLLGNYHEGNFGDDALLVACAALFKGQAQPLSVRGNIAYKDARLSGLRSEKNVTGSPNLIVYGGGTQFFSFNSTDTVPDPLQPRRKVLVQKLLSPSSVVSSIRTRMRRARLQHVPKIAIGIGVGPFNDAASAEVAAALLRRMAFVWVRDALSEEFCRSNGVENLVVSADLCFTDAFAGMVHRPRDRRQTGGQASRVGIILRDWGTLDARFFQRQIAAAQKLRTLGHKVQFLALSPHDEMYLSEMAAANEEVHVWNAEEDKLERFWEVIGNQDLVITSRFHGAIFSLLSRTPFIAIEIEPKLRNLRTVVPELAAFAVSPSVDADHLCTLAEALLAHREQTAPALERALSRQCMNARRGEQALATFLESEKGQ
ncbi:polysaccharide pyruvyl transferase family protein [Oryzicola mucosus]|uniref:Polysaccharide pyruvyl transferase family protein n=1 Tax=Oryzicola mucosus TaxID=2767425 RepID=A0A8J6U6N7_9HYPH|nr:polysaccharide pyruvyl transferase family protein [Oryzicola mucosus]MBD0413472.1 polysaccharide pyruvyl transferase family protein [Oryzicola mucosus]